MINHKFMFFCSLNCTKVEALSESIIQQVNMKMNSGCKLLFWDVEETI